MTESVDNLCESSDEMLVFMKEQVSGTYGKLIETSGQYKADADLMKEILKKYSDAAGQISAEMSSMLDSFVGLKQATAEGAAGISDVADHVGEISNMASTVQQESHNLKEISVLLEAMMGKFKVS